MLQPIFYSAPAASNKIHSLTSKWSQTTQKESSRLVNLNPRHNHGVNFINVLHTHFLYKILEPKISNPKHSVVIFVAKILYEKRVRKTLMKLTHGVLHSHDGHNLYLFQEVWPNLMRWSFTWSDSTSFRRFQIS